MWSIPKLNTSFVVIKKEQSINIYYNMDMKLKYITVGERSWELRTLTYYIFYLCEEYPQQDNI